MRDATGDRRLGAAQLEKLYDELCIRRLAHEYADSMLTKDGARMLALWAADVAAASPPDLDIDWARRLPARWSSWGVTMLHVTTHAIVFDGPNAAHGRVQCIAQMEREEGLIEQAVLYEDDYVRRGEGWLFASRRHRLWFGKLRADDPLQQRKSTWPLEQTGRGTLAEDLQRLWNQNAAARLPGSQLD